MNEIWSPVLCTKDSYRIGKISSEQHNGAFFISRRSCLITDQSSKFNFAYIDMQYEWLSTAQHTRPADLEMVWSCKSQPSICIRRLKTYWFFIQKKPLSVSVVRSQIDKESMAFLHLPSSLVLKTSTHPASPPPVTASRSSLPILPIQNSVKLSNWVLDFQSKSLNFALSGALALALSVSGIGVAEAKVGVNKPELLPKEFTTVIDVAGFLSDGQEKRLAQEIADIEKDTGFKLRLLAQNYPDTPGLAIRDFWQVDDRTIVFVADPNFGNILNFNVGASVDLDIPRSFWNRLAGKYGNMFYWKEKGEDSSIEAAVMAISNCLREPVSSNNCAEVK